MLTRGLAALFLLTLLPAGAETARPAKRSAPAKPAGAVARAVASTGEFERTLRLQIFLDEETFGPGLVDGRAGEFTRKARAAWNVAHGHTDPDDPAPTDQAARKGVRTLFAVYKIKPGDLAYVTPALPEQPQRQVSVAFLGYRSLAEFVAERYHTSEALLARLNPKAPLTALRPGVALKVPNVEPFVIEALQPLRAWSAERRLSRRSVLVNVRDRTAAIYDENGGLFALFPITPGEPKFVALGEWKIEVMTALPRFRWDKQMLEQGTRSQSAYLLPPGPNSPVGVLWAGLNRSGIGLHGSATPETIGRSRSHGCIRLANWDAVRLPQLLRPGARVIVE